MKKLLLLCLLIDCSIASAAESANPRDIPSRSTPRVLEYHPDHRSALPKRPDRTQWVEVLRDAFQPLRHSGGERNDTRPRLLRERAGAGPSAER